MNPCSCQSRFQPTTHHGYRVLRCAGCNSAFVPKFEFERMFRSLVRQFTQESLGALAAQCKARREQLVSSAAEGNQRLYLPCPACDQQMTRKAFSRLSGIVIHHCSDHGVLGAKGWIENACDFISKGGEVLTLKEKLVATRGASEKSTQEESKKPGAHEEDMPIVLLID